MTHSAQRHTNANPILRGLSEQFAQLHARSYALLKIVRAEDLYRQPRASNGAAIRASSSHSCGEHLLRAAAAVEQTFGGITVNLWDDPFEWTLPETLSTPERVTEYLIEVEATRQRGFQLFRGDADLQKEIVVPSGERKTLYALMLETLARASHHQGRAFAAFSFFSDVSLPPI